MNIAEKLETGNIITVTSDGKVIGDYWEALQKLEASRAEIILHKREEERLKALERAMVQVEPRKEPVSIKRGYRKNGA